MKKKTEFYKYVLSNVKTIPFSSVCFDFSKNSLVLEEDFISHINKKYALEIINFEQKSEFFCFPLSIREEQKILDTITYGCKVDNQLYLQYKSVNANTTESDKYVVVDMIAYSNPTNKKELISFLQYITEYIKNKQ